MSIIEEKLAQIKKISDEGMDAKNTVKVLNIIGIDGYTEELIDSFKLWSDYMPLMDEEPYTKEQRNYHILWESIDKVPLGINMAFAIPYRQILAKKMFKKCGDGFVCSENCRFNFANKIEIGENVSWNAGCFIDSKGGVKFGDFSMLTECVKIFTHGHSEGDHMVRSYNGVEIKKYAKVYTACTILPGVIIGEGAICATGAIVTKNVDDFTLVGGIPAKPMRKRNFEDNDYSKMNQYMLKDRYYQVYNNKYK